MYKKHSRQISIDTLKLLLARSGNQCAFPGCTHPLFNDENVFITQLCHIEAVAPNGQRYNAAKSNAETNGYDNLLFLCYRHHKETDDVVKYPVERLKEIKSTHETKFKEATYNYDQRALEELLKETTSYWETIEKLQENHVAPDLKVPIDTNRGILSLISDVDNNLSSLYDVSKFLMETHTPENFEYTCLALPNFLTRISVSVAQIEIKYIEELLLKDTGNKELKERLTYLRDRFKDTAQSAGLAD